MGDKHKFTATSNVLAWGRQGLNMSRAFEDISRIVNVNSSARARSILSEVVGLRKELESKKFGAAKGWIPSASKQSQSAFSPSCCVTDEVEDFDVILPLYDTHQQLYDRSINDLNNKQALNMGE